VPSRRFLQNSNMGGVRIQPHVFLEGGGWGDGTKNNFSAAFVNIIAIKMAFVRFFAGQQSTNLGAAPGPPVVACMHGAMRRPTAGD